MWVAGHAVAEDFRVTDHTRAVVILKTKALENHGVNSTMKSVLFWMGLVVVGVLVWNFSTKFQTRERPVSFSEFMAWRRVRPGDARSPSPATKSAGSTKANETLPDLRSRLNTTGSPTSSSSAASRHREGTDARAPGPRCSIPGRRSCC